MRVLILSCNTGQGHNSAAAAIKDQLQSKGHCCDTVDSLQFIAPWVSAAVAKGHTFIYRHIPWLFRWGYGYAERNRGVFRHSSLLYRFLTHGSARLYHYCAANKYDAVVAVHVFSALMLTDAASKYTLNAKTYFLATDYTCSPSTEESSLDGYFIPSPMLTEEFAKYGIPRDKLIPGGIPIRSDFSKCVPKQIAKQRLGIPPERPHLLMMCGSMGCDPMGRLALRLAQKMPDENVLTVVCGTNKKLYRKLTKRLQSHENIRILGYADNISLLMDSADLYVTKPGGISVTEAAVKGLPMVFIDAVAGCEEFNMHYFIQRGGAVTAKRVTELTKLCIKLMCEPQTRAKLSNALYDMNLQNSAEYICQYIEEATK